MNRLAMRRITRLATCFGGMLLSWHGVAQTSPGVTSFEVASVKPAPPDAGGPGANKMQGGPGTDDPERIVFRGVTLKRLLMAAYGVDEDQIVGPNRLVSER